MLSPVRALTLGLFLFSPSAHAADGGLAPARALMTLKAGDALPDVQLVDSAGANAHLLQWRGSVVALSFVFTSCPFAEYCPRITGTLEKTRAILTKSKMPWHFVTVTIDPERDTPPVLATYAKRHHALATEWTFLTGDKNVIDELCERFDVERVNENGQLQHTLRTIVVAPDGTIAKIYSDSSFSAAELAEAMTKASPPAR